MADPDTGETFAGHGDRVVKQRRVWKSAEQAAFRIVRDITAGGLVEGDRLPLEAELVEHYGVGRESIREALRLLEAQGIITIRRGPGGGPIVGRAESSNLARTMTLFFQLGGATYDDLLKSWCSLEPGVAERAAANLDRRLVEELMTPHLTRFEDGGDRQRYTRHSNTLHFSLAALDDNPVLRMLVAAVGDIVRTHVILQVDPFSIREAIDDEHRAIAEAVLAGDTVRAAEASRLHSDHLNIVYRRHWDGSLDDSVEWK